MCSQQCDCVEEELDLTLVKEILEGYEKKQKNLIPILQETQEEYGYLPQEVLREVADSLGISFSQVYGVATFYSQFYLEPRGEYIVRVCMGTACHVRGAGKILEEFEEELGIEDGGTTDDLLFTIESVACIGACGLAPVIMVNDDTHGRLTPEDVPEILAQYGE